MLLYGLEYLHIRTCVNCSIRFIEYFKTFLTLVLFGIVMVLIFMFVQIIFVFERCFTFITNETLHSYCYSEQL